MSYNNREHPKSYDECLQIWTETFEVEPEEIEIREDEDLNLSLDLKEATYNMPFDLLRENLVFMDQTMKGFAPWDVHKELFHSLERYVDMSNLADKGYWDGPETVLSLSGSFMGDGLSFIHLTLMLVGAVRAIYSASGIPRPCGQSVGDDLMLIKTKLKECILLLQLLEALGCEFSKLNSICKDAITFCEQYVARVSNHDAYVDLESMKNSIFHDLIYLDTIKGNILSGFGKVKQDKSAPFMGHAKMLNKQISWHPTAYVKERSKVFLWANNYMSAHRLGSNMASLPNELGGIDLAVGPTITFDSERFKGLRPYYEAMLKLDREKFLTYFTLLQGIYKANPKGFKWSNDFDLIKGVVEGCVIHDIPNLDTCVPEYMLKEPALKKLAYIQNELGMVSFRFISDFLARQEAFLNCWEGKKPEGFTTLLSKDAKQRANKAWGIIKSNLEPVPEEELRFHSFSALKHAFSVKTWGLYVSKTDQAIADAFAGMPTLLLDFEVY